MVWLAGLCPRCILFIGVTRMGDVRAPVRKKLTFEEFLAWCDEDTWAEWEDGEVIMLTPASRRHENIGDFLVAVLRIFTEVRGLGKVISAPFTMKTGPDLPAREPDLLFVAREHLGRLRETYLDGPADLVVEITSSESGERDRGKKFYEYEAGGVQEYWLIDPDRREAEFYRLREGRYRLCYPEGGIYRSQVVPGFWLSVDWLWQEPLPSPVRVLAEIAGVDSKVAEAFERGLAGT